MKLIGYIRVSTEGQAETGLGLAAQEEKIRRYCELYEHELVEVISDAGVSGSTLNRAGLKRGLNMLEANMAEGIIVTNFDRLTRDIYDMGKLLKHYFAANFKLIDVEQQLDTSTATGKLMLNFLLSISQWERERIGERTTAALRQKRVRGEYTGGGVPYGYCVEDGNLVPDEYEQEVLSQAKSMHGNGTSYRSIAAKLAKRGFFSRTGGAFHHTQVKRIISNEVCSVRRAA